MLRYRLLFGTLMIAAFLGLVLLDAHLDGGFTASDSAPLLSVKATILTLLIVMLAIPAQLELTRLVSATGVYIFKPISIIATVLLATSWYWPQFMAEAARFHLFYLLLVSAWTLLSIMLHQGVRFGPDGAIANCSANFFAVFYLGLLSSFFLGIRIDFGFWAVLMFVFTIKSSDIGAYAVGKLFGRHKCFPKISPGKTWEGLGGAVIFSAATAYLFSVFCGIISPPVAIAFGVIFAIVGQLADLAESLIKRDAGQKDASHAVPGFGGLLDVIDSPLAAAPLAYLFFMLAAID